MSSEKNDSGLTVKEMIIVTPLLATVLALSFGMGSFGRLAKIF